MSLSSKMFAVRKKKTKTHGKQNVHQHKNARHTIFLPGVFFCRVPWKMRMTKLLFAVRPRICA
jgi:hypothetical protein